MSMPTNLLPIFLGIFTLLMLPWQVYVTLVATEVDKSQEAVQDRLAGHETSLVRLSSDIHDIPLKMSDRYTGKQADIQNSSNTLEKKALRRELDKMYIYLWNHKHQHKDVIHEIKHD